jgi:hypothetical protein
MINQQIISMANLIITGGGSEILEILIDDHLCEDYKIIRWDMDDDTCDITIDFIDNDHKFNFICDNNLEEIAYNDPKYIPFKEIYRIN